MTSSMETVIGLLTGTTEEKAAETLAELAELTSSNDDPDGAPLSATALKALKTQGVRLVGRDPQDVIKRGAVQDEGPVNDDPDAFPTVTRVMRRLKPGLYVVSTREHTALIHRLPGFVYDKQNPCLFIYDGRGKPRPVGREQGGMAAARVQTLFKVTAADKARSSIRDLVA